MTMLPDEIIAQLAAEFQCRDQQIHHLAALYSVGTSTRL
jgi:origin recognition complex subunit 5